MPTVLAVQHEEGAPLDRLGTWLAEAGVDVRLCRPYAGDAVPEVVGVDGLIVLGGHMGAYDDDVAPWLPATRQLLRSAVATGVPTLGVCLGAQLLAVACGGRVEVGRAGIEAGVVDVWWRPEADADLIFGAAPAVNDDLTTAPPLPGPTSTPTAAGSTAPRSTAGPSMHLDAVVELPPGAVWLGETCHYPHQAFRVGDRAWGVQFHPEVSLAVFTAWGHEHDAEWAGWGLDGDEVVAQLGVRDAEVSAGGRALARRFAAILGAPTRAAR